MKIPMVDLKAQYRDLQEEIDAALQSVVHSGQFVLGPQVLAFEREVAAYCDVRHAVSVASGTDALHLALRAAGVGPGVEVITTPFTFIATAGAISQTGARPVFADIDPATFNIDPARVAKALTSRTRAVLPVHLYGQPADLAPIREICLRHRLALIEDCAQSFGAEYGGRKSGAYGDMGCFSFYPSKNLGAYGDGGMVITNDDAAAERLRRLRDHGRIEGYRHGMVGYNSRLDELQAAVLRVKLAHQRVDEQAQSAPQGSEERQGEEVEEPEEEDGEPGHARACRTTRAISSISSSDNSGYMGSDSTSSAAASAPGKRVPP